ncbi:MAG: ABC transporter ATP-binding protein [Clostridia bacterium]|nr:ABC transporter ATP-binding protein [Clostridia bacterium]
MTEYVLETKDLTKKYSKKAVVDNLNIKIRKGDIYGFIGKNGAGKTTTIKMIAGLANPTSGAVSLFGSDNLADGRKKIGTIIENPAIYPYMNARQNIEVQRILKGVDDKSIVDQILDIVGLSGAGNKKAKKFSLGMKQRLAIAIALVGSPELLILDEPINGLDPIGIKDIRNLILKLTQEAGITVLISSHILGELMKIATCYGIIKDGKLVKQMTAEELGEIVKPQAEFVVNDPEKTQAILKEVFGISNMQVQGNWICIHEAVERYDEIKKYLEENDIVITSARKANDDYEEYLIKLMEEGEE